MIISKFSLKQVLKLYYDIYILNDDLKEFKSFERLRRLEKSEVRMRKS